MKIARIHTYKNGNIKIKLNQHGIYVAIRNNLNFRFSKVDNKGYFFKKDRGIYKTCSIYDIKKAFIEYLKANVDNVEIDGEIEILDLINEVYRKNPIKNNVNLRDELGKEFELSCKELHLVRIQTDSTYMYKFERSKMKGFIKNEKFKLINRTFGNFFNNDDKIYIKKVINDVFLILRYPNWNNEKSQPVYDLFKIKCKNEKELFNKRDEEIKNLILGFKLEEFHLEIYDFEKNKTCANIELTQ